MKKEFDDCKEAGHFVLFTRESHHDESFTPDRFRSLCENLLQRCF